jgi:hypothetical protein
MSLVKTLQEYLFSTRAVIFTPHQVLFSCHRGIQQEDCEGRVRERFLRTAGQLRKEDENGSGRLLSYYAPIVSMYTERDISFQKDGLKAFSGVCKSLEHVFGPFSWGLSGCKSEYFLWGLSWSLYGNIRRRPDFPSWTWVGWEYTENTKRKDRRMSHQRLEPVGSMRDCSEVMVINKTSEGVQLQPQEIGCLEWKRNAIWPEPDRKLPIKGLYFAGPWNSSETAPTGLGSARVLSIPTFVARLDINKTRFELNCRPGPLSAKLPSEPWLIHFMVISVRRPEVIILPIQYNDKDISYRIDNPQVIEEDEWLSYKPMAGLVYLG